MAVAAGIFYFFAGLAAKNVYVWMRDKRRRGGREENSLLIITSSDRAEKILENLCADHSGRFHIAGIAAVDMDYAEEGSEICGVPVVAGRSDLIGFVKKEWIDEVFIDISGTGVRDRKLEHALFQMGIAVHLKLAETTETNGRRRFVEQLGNYTVITTSMNCATPLQLFLKRMMDIVGGMVGCVCAGVLFLILAPVIYIKSPGPVLFSQTRVGKNGRKFKIYKFRSMYVDAEERKKELDSQNRIKSGLMFKVDWDPRIIGSRTFPDGTVKKGIGNYMRDWSLDEFPQFFNVLKGDMSLVGTRPPTVDEWEKYELHHRARLAVRPGITGMWQVSGRSGITDFEEVVKLDTYYIRHWSIGLDIRILLKTVVVVIRKIGAM